MNDSKKIVSIVIRITEKTIS